jgi:hypothetical protein
LISLDSRSQRIQKFLEPHSLKDGNHIEISSSSENHLVLLIPFPILPKLKYSTM